MNALTSLSRGTLAIWLAAFFSPTAYFLLLLVADSFHVPSQPESVVASVFYLLPLIALLICSSIIWSFSLTSTQKLRWLLLTVGAMFVQFGLVLAVLVAATGYAPGK